MWNDNMWNVPLLQKPFLFDIFLSFSYNKTIRWRKPQKGSPVKIRRSPRYCKADEIHRCHWETGKAWRVG